MKFSRNSSQQQKLLSGCHRSAVCSHNKSDIFFFFKTLFDKKKHKPVRYKTKLKGYTVAIEIFTLLQKIIPPFHTYQECF